LLFEVNESEGVIFEDRREACNVARKYVELVDARGSQSEEPYLRFD
jgi:hypothetical protein